MGTSQQPTTNDQHKQWKGAVGNAWVEAQDLLNGLFIRLEEHLVQAAMNEKPTRVLDIGCGPGATILAVAKALGPQGSYTGVDISEALVATATARAESENLKANFICADAQTYPFPPASFDLIQSRFGVMFFDDPVAAFTNIRHAAAPGATLRLIAWRSPADNPFMTAAERAAAPLMPDLPPRIPDAPGQFGFANKDRVQNILAESGWSAIDIQPLDVPCAMPHANLSDYYTRLGPLAHALRDLKTTPGEELVNAVRSAFDPYIHDGEVRFNAACWLITAKN